MRHLKVCTLAAALAAAVPAHAAEVAIVTNDNGVRFTIDVDTIKTDKVGMAARMYAYENGARRPLWITADCTSDIDSGALSWQFWDVSRSAWGKVLSFYWAKGGGKVYDVIGATLCKVYPGWRAENKESEM